MASRTSIANRALKALGAKTVESIDQDHPNARSIKNSYDSIRDAELRRYDWSFAIKRASIAADTSDTLWGDWNRYALPNDFLKLIRDDESGTRVDWRIEGRYIVTADAAPLDIRYVARITDPNQYDPMFLEAFALQLAHDSCQEITQSNGKKQQIKADYKEAIAEARRVGAIEKPSQISADDDWLSARI
jgi:hypothetical protein